LFANIWKIWNIRCRNFAQVTLLVEKYTILNVSSFRMALKLRTSWASKERCYETTAKCCNFTMSMFFIMTFNNVSNLFVQFNCCSCANAKEKRLMVCRIVNGRSLFLTEIYNYLIFVGNICLCKTYISIIICLL